MADFPKMGKIRHAVGPLYGREILETVVIELAVVKVDVQALSLMAGPYALDPQEFGSPDTQDSQVASLLNDLTEMKILRDAGPVTVSLGPLIDVLRTPKQHIEPRESPILEDWLPKGSAAYLQEQVDKGALLLWARVRDSDEEQRATTALLKHSQGQVQVHDLSRG